MNITRRGLLKLGAGVGLPSGFLGGCGGDSGETISEEVTVAAELVDEVLLLEPVPSTLDLSVNPLQIVQGITRILVIQDGEALSGATLQGLGADGTLIFTGITDAQGEFVWNGARMLGLQVLVHGPRGQLSLYVQEDSALNLAPLIVNVVTTLADRVRQVRKWLPSQANMRVHQFLSIPLDTPLTVSFIDSTEFSHFQFAHSQEASGLSQDAYLNQLAHQAAADDYEAHARSFTEAARLRLIPSSILEGVNLLLGFGLNVLDRHLSDEQKLNLFGGLLVEIGLLHDDPTLKIVMQIVERLDDIQRSLDLILNEVYNSQLIGLRLNIKKLDDAMVAIQAKLANPELQRHPAVLREEIIRLIEEKELTDGTLPLLIVKEFIGGMGSTFGMGDRVYPVLFKRENHIDAETGKFLSGVDEHARNKFYSKSKEGVYEDALKNVLVLYAVSMSWILSYRAGKASEVKSDAIEYSKQMVLQQAAAREMVTVLKLLTELGSFKPLPHESVFLNIEDNAAWFNSREQITKNPNFHGGWHAWDGSWTKGKAIKSWSKGNLRMAYKKLPLGVQAMGGEPHTWGPPSFKQVESTFFKPLQKTGHKNVETYALAHGAPATGVYLINEKGKPALNIWLSDLTMSENNWGMCDFIAGKHCSSPLGGSWFGKYSRNYARMAQRNHSSGKNLNFSGSVRDGDWVIFQQMGRYVPFAEYAESYANDDPSTRGLTKLGNFDKSVNYYYPVNTQVTNVMDYYPWHVYRRILAETSDFSMKELFARYSTEKSAG